MTNQLDSPDGIPRKDSEKPSPSLVTIDETSKVDRESENPAPPAGSEEAKNRQRSRSGTPEGSVGTTGTGSATI